MNTKLLLAVGLLAVPTLLLMAESPEKEKPKSPEAPKHFDKQAMQHRLEEFRKMRGDPFAKNGASKEGRKGAPDAGKREKLGQMHAQIEELHRAGKHKEAEELRNKFAGELMGAHKGGQAKVGSPNERLEHLSEAIKHLHAAGMHEPAENLEQAAKHMREETQGKKHSEPRGNEGELQELRQQMQKLMHSVEELRGQLKKPQGDNEVRKPEKP